jgi:adenylate cyclase
MMSSKQASVPQHLLEERVSELSQVAHHILVSLQKSGVSVPTNLIDTLGQLVNSLNEFGKQAGKYETERDNLQALADIGQIVNSSLELNEVLRIVMDTIVRLTGAERGFLMLPDEKGDLTIRIARNWEQETINPSEFEISRTIIKRVTSEGKPILTTNAQEDPRFGGQESIIAYNLRSILCVPLTVKGGEITGVIYADNRIRTGLFTDIERDLLSAFANQAAVAIENARLFESVRRTLAEVTELKNLMDNVFSSIVSGVITSNVEDQITLCNQAAGTILGKKTQEVIGHYLNDVLPLPTTDLSKYINLVRQRNESIVGLEINPVIPKRGQVTWSLNLSPLKDAASTTQGVAIVLDDLTDKKRLEAERQLFEKMVSPAVISQLDPHQLQLGGKRTDITSLFADIRGFTKYSEPLKPELLVSVLNRYLAAAADAILAQEGTIDKFLGDGLMAWFNAPISQPDHTLRAVKAALGIRNAIQKLHNELPSEAHLSFGVGIHFGEAVLGLVGTEKRVDYTAIGDSVNTAKRIQENSTANQILISSAAYKLVEGKVKIKEVEPVLAKGKSEPIPVYEITGLV